MPKLNVEINKVEGRLNMTVAERRKVRDMIFKTAPDTVLNATDKQKDIYFKYHYLEYLIEHHPKRFFTFKAHGKDNAIDLCEANFLGLIKSRGGGVMELQDARDQKAIHLRNLNDLYTMCKARYMKAFKVPTNNNPIVTHEEEVKDYLGKFYTIEDIIKIFRNKVGYKPTKKEIQDIYINNKFSIDERRKKYVENTKSFRISTDVGRLEVLNELLVDTQMRYEKSQSNNDAAQILKILEQARKEIKGEQLKLTVEGTIDIQATMAGRDAALKTMRTLNISALVIGLTAAKSGLNPSVLIGQLASSWYKDVNGFTPIVGGKRNVMLPGELIKSYDWGELRSKAESFVEDMTPISEALEVVEEEREAVEYSKNSILQKIESFRSKNNVSQSELGGFIPKK